MADGRTIKWKWVTAEVVDKTSERKGWFFKKTVYILTLRFPEGNPEIISWTASPKDYYRAEIGEQIRVKMYLLPNGNWTPVAELAEYYWTN